MVTLTAVRPPARFGALKISGKKVKYFKEKPVGQIGWVNGGFFVLEPEIFNYIEDDNTIWENEPLIRLALEKNLMAFKHEGFWQPMDTLRDKLLLEDFWKSGNAQWKLWE